MIYRWAAALAATVLFTVGTAHAELPGPLVDADWLAENRAAVRVVEVHPDAAGEPTIPGAAVVGMDALRMTHEVGDETFDDLALDAPSFQALMRELAIDGDDDVVVAWTGQGASGVSDAAYLYWQLRLYGHEEVALLDGGVAGVAAMAEGWPVPAPSEGPAFTAELQDGYRITTPALATLVAAGNAPALVDNRPLAYHVGLARKDYVARDGHIPGSTLLPFDFLVTGSDGATFRPVDRLKTLAMDLRVPAAGPVVAYCNSGRVSALGWFVMNELLGVETLLYDGSLHAWAQAEARPMTTRLEM